MPTGRDSLVVSWTLRARLHWLPTVVWCLLLALVTSVASSSTTAMLSTSLHRVETRAVRRGCLLPVAVVHYKAA